MTQIPLRNGRPRFNTDGEALFDGKFEFRILMTRIRAQWSSRKRPKATIEIQPRSADKDK